MNLLPIHDVLDEIRDTLKTHNRLILQAPPGAGKTTAVPLSLLNEPWLENKQIIMLEPRRIAARSAAARMAQLLGENVGERIGYQIRAEKKLSDKTKILVVTEGILTRMLQNNPALEDIALIIFDEFHERHLHSDLSLAFALQSQECLRDDLKIIVMSATLDIGSLQSLLNHPPLITSEGRDYPITIEHLPPNSSPIEPKKILPSLMEILQNVFRNDKGSILVFLPGMREIKLLEASLKEYCKTLDIFIAPLYGVLSKAQQERAIAPSNKRKIVLATNISPKRASPLKGSPLSSIQDWKKCSRLILAAAWNGLSPRKFPVPPPISEQVVQAGSVPANVTVFGVLPPTTRSLPTKSLRFASVISPLWRLNWRHGVIRNFYGSILHQ